MEYTDLAYLLTESDIVSLHCPLTDETKYLIKDQTLGLMKKGSMLINTARGALIDTRADIEALKRRDRLSASRPQESLGLNCNPSPNTSANAGHKPRISSGLFQSIACRD